MSIISFFTGIFRKYLLFTFIIFVHELGHFLCGVFLGWRVDKIYIYPYGGCTKFQEGLNVSLFREILVLVAGPCLQILVYALAINLVRVQDIAIFSYYHYTILWFNLLPIYPLDGGRLLNIGFNYFFSYKTSLFLSYLLSIFLIPIIFFYHKALILYLVFALLLWKLWEEFKNRDHVYNKFLLERYLYTFPFYRKKVIRGMNQFFRDRRHVVKFRGKYQTEREALKKYFHL